MSPPAQFVSVPNVTIPAPTSPGPEPIPPQAVPVAPRGNVPDTTAAPSAGHTAAGVADPFLLPGVSGLDSFAVPSGIVSTVPGVLAGTSAQRPGGAPRFGAHLARYRADGHRPGLATGTGGRPVG